jgi:iron complex outermembrane receptor protein
MLHPWTGRSCAAALAVAAAAAAQEPSAPADAPPADEVATIPVEPEASPPAQEDAARFDDVVVTATKRAVSAREIPATVNALDGGDLERIGAQGVDDFVKLVPGVNINDDGGFGPKRITVRGITGEVQTVFATGVLFGDVPFSDLFIPFFHLDPNPFDLATVEVLKGPHGTLFGGYGLNGLIRYVPEPPKLAATELKYYVQRLSLSEGGREPAFGAVVNLPAGDTAALRLMGFRRDAPGYVDDTQAGVPDVNTLGQSGYRGMMAWEPAARWRVSFLHTAQDTHVADLASTDNPDGRLERGHTPRPSPTETAYSLTSLGAGYALDWAQLAAQASHVTKDFDNFLDLSRVGTDGQTEGLGNQYLVSSEALVLELRLLSPEDGDDGPWRWLVGLFGTPTDFYACFDTYAPAPPLPVAQPSPCPGTRAASPYIAGQFLAYAQTTDVAAFGEVTRSLGDHWDVTLGARWYRTQLTGQVVTSGAAFEDSSPGPTERQPDLEEAGLNPRLSVSWRPTGDVMGYASVARGFRFGGIQLAGDPLGNDLPDTYRSDVLWNYEAGARVDWLGRTLQTDAAAYYIEWQDPQLLQRTPDGLFTYTDNVGGAEGRGVELALRWLVPFVDGLTLSAQGAWNETVTTAAFTASSGTPVEPGSPWPYAPEWQTAAALSYVLPLGAWQGAVSLRHNHVSAAWNVVERTAPVFDYETYDAQLGISNLAWRWLPEIGLVGTNLTDARGKTGVVLLPGADPSVTYLQPRALMLRLAGAFGS